MFMVLGLCFSQHCKEKISGTFPVNRDKRQWGEKKMNIENIVLYQGKSDKYWKKKSQ